MTAKIQTPREGTGCPNGIKQVSFRNLIQYFCSNKYNIYGQNIQQITIAVKWAMYPR
jgi:hypothetical protein